MNEINWYDSLKFCNNPYVTKDEIYKAFSILLLSGYVTVSTRRLFRSVNLVDKFRTRNNAHNLTLYHTYSAGFINTAVIK